MAKCTKCSNIIADSDKIYWKCPECAKVFQINLSKLKGLQIQKKRKPGESLLKCPNCSYGMDDGNEKIAYKCKVCENVVGGNLEFFTQEDSEPVLGTQLQAPTVFCGECGKEYAESAAFCPNCGKPRVRQETGVCRNCGAKLEPTVRFCPDCGTQVDANSATPVLQNGRIQKKFPIKKIAIASAAVILLIALSCAGVYTIPKLLVTPEELMSQGNFEKAYSKAKDEEKTQVLVQNLLADICNEVKDTLKDPSSFELRKVWYETTGKKRIVLQVSGTNSMGGVVSNYWLYLFNEEEGAYEGFAAIADMEEEEYKSYDDVDDTAEKVVNNLARLCIAEICVASTELDQELVDCINTLNHEDLLRDIELLDEVKTIYPFGIDDEGESDTVV